MFFRTMSTLMAPAIWVAACTFVCAIKMFYSPISWTPATRFTFCISLHKRCCWTLKRWGCGNNITSSSAIRTNQRSVSVTCCAPIRNALIDTIIRIPYLLINDTASTTSVTKKFSISTTTATCCLGKCIYKEERKEQDSKYFFHFEEFKSIYMSRL